MPHHMPDMPGNMLVDSHCHLDYDDLASRLPEVIENAEKSGVGVLLSISTTLHGFPNIRSITEKYDTVYCTVGIHPYEAANEGLVSPEQLTMYAEHPKVVGFGESGLDYCEDRNPPPKDIQQKQFIAHIKAAQAAQLPLVIHARDADDDIARILKEQTEEGGNFPFILHCFSSGEALAQAGLELGGYISFSGILTFKKSDDLRQIAKNVPQNRLLIETDAPFLAPEPMRGKPNEPAYVVHIAERLADIHKYNSQRNGAYDN